MKFCVTSAITLLLLVSAQFASAGDDSASIDACVLVNSADNSNHRVISVSGLISSSDEELVLTCEKDPDRKVWLNFPDEQIGKQDETLTPRSLAFHRTKTSDLFVSYLLQQCSERRFTATLRGYFEYKKQFKKSAGDGYGHLGAYQYRLIVTDVETVDGEPCEEYPAM
jgi:hypothetical protein